MQITATKVRLNMDLVYRAMNNGALTVSDLAKYIKGER